MKRTGGFLLLILSLNLAYAQVSGNDIQFETERIDLGEIEASSGDQEIRFKFYNQGADTFRIQEINVACGCTRESRFRKVIPAGDSGEVKVTFNPKGMVGKANKWIQVRGNFNDIPYKELRFHATVTDRRVQKDVIDQNYYPGQYGYVMILDPLLAYGNRYQGFVATDSIEILNDGEVPYTVHEAKDLPPYLTILNLPLRIEGKSSAYLYVQADTRSLDTIGQMGGSFHLLTNDFYLKTKQVNYSFYLQQDFSKMGWWARRKAPHISLSKTEVPMGTMRSGQVRTKKLIIGNTGKRPLQILRMDSDCACAIIQDLPDEIPAGTEVEVDIRFDAVFKKGPQRKVITLFTNDPDQEIVEVFVTAYVD